MKPVLKLVLVLLTLTLASYAEDARSRNLLSIDGEKQGDYPTGWGGGPHDTIRLEGEPGKFVARFERADAGGSGFSTLTKSVPLDFEGERIEMRGFLRTQDVSGFAGLWMRQDAPDQPGAAFTNMQDQGIKGTTEWKEYSISLPLVKSAKSLYFGVLVAGSGSGWARGLTLLVDGKPIAEAPKRATPQTVLDRDHEFDEGSKISVDSLTQQQIANLVLLGKVWGFLKYHHPRIAAGEKHFDYELFRVTPAVLAATNQAAAQRAVDEWIKRLGPVEDCTKCAEAPGRNVHLSPQADWIANQSLVGAGLSAALSHVYRNRFAGREQFYVSLAPGVGNPVFDHELAYSRTKYPDAGYRLLAAFRFWNIVEYWFPYRNQLSDNRDKVLAEFIPRVMLAKDAAEYQRELMALIAKAHDTHANLWSSIGERPPAGPCQLPVTTRFVEGQAFVTEAAGAESTVKEGDLILALDGVPVSDLVKKWAPYYAASNEPTRLRDIGSYLTRGACGDAAVRVRRGTDTLEVTAARQKSEPRRRGSGWHDRPGDAFQKLSDQVAYLKLGSIKQGEAKRHVEAAKGTKGLILDLRNYPSALVVFELGSLLVDKETAFLVLTVGDPANPGAFRFREELTLTPGKPRYEGKVIILVDEVTQSSAEYHAMAFRKAPGALVIGSTTAGADGNVSPFALPGGLRSMVSGIGVFYPDRTPTQRIGIVPDVVVQPTLAGLRAGRDEVLEEAIRRIERD